MNNLIIYSLICLSGIFISSIAQILLKISTFKKYKNIVFEYLNNYVIIAYALFFIGTILGMISYRYVPLSMGPILASSEYVFVAILGYIILHERIGKKKFFGLIVIIIGIIVFSI